MEIKFDKPIPSKMRFEGTEIEYKNHLSVSDMANLINSYCQMYFYTVGQEDKFVSMTRFNLLEAEVNLKIGLIKLMTNIDTTDENGDVLFSIDDFETSGLFDEITGRIYNYPEFRNLLDKTVEDIKRDTYESESVNASIKKVIDSVYSFIQKMNETDLTPESMEKIKKLSEEILSNVEQSPIADAIEDKTRKTRKKKATE